MVKRTRQPTHPGEILREDVLSALNLSVSAAARTLGVSRQVLHAILKESAGITPEMAVRIGRMCGNGPRIWLDMQTEFDLWRATRKLAEEIKRIPELAA